MECVAHDARRQACLNRIVSTEWIVHQLSSAPIRLVEPARHNSRKGTPIPGAATATVLVYLQQRASVGVPWANHAQILRGTGCTTKALCWALMYLQALHQVEAVPDHRNPRYRRYRLVLSGAKQHDANQPR